MENPFLIGLSFDQHKPGMKLYIHHDYENLKTGDIVEIQDMSGFDKEKGIFTFPFGTGDLYFVTTNNVKIIWNEAKISCYIERDDTTAFLEKMFDHYKVLADQRMKDPNYDWPERNYDDFLEDKYSTLEEIVLEYEYKRIKEIGATI
ncbi:TPA: hypothetical protein ROX88_001167 [Bacillus pseudomycoides]|nr:hypothetical protein [Bacillus pseudomycoides]